MKKLIKLAFAHAFVWHGIFSSSVLAEECDRGAKFDTEAVIKMLGSKKFLLVGEGHGRREMRPIMEELFCRLNKQKKTILYAWELPEDLERDFILYLDGRTNISDQELLANPVWHIPSGGSTSIDKLELHKYLRFLNQNGAKIS